MKGQVVDRSVGRSVGSFVRSFHTVLYCTVLYCTVLYCTVVGCSQVTRSNVLRILRNSGKNFACLEKFFSLMITNHQSNDGTEGMCGISF